MGSFGCRLCLLLCAVLAASVAQAQSRAQFRAGDAAEDLFRQGKVAEAAAAFGKLAQADPTNSYAWYRAGVAFRAAGELELALEHLTRAADFRAYELEALLERARAETALGESELALASLRALIDRGYERSVRILADEDLAALREEERYRAMQRELLEARPRVNVRQPSFSPDGEWIVFQALLPGTGTYDLHVIRPGGGEVRRITVSSDHDHQPTWSPDGERIAFVRVERFTGKNALWTIAQDGSDARKLTSSLQERLGLANWTPDGRELLHHRWIGDNSQIWTHDLESGESVPLLEDGQDKGNALIGPDGYLYYDARGEDDTWPLYRHDLESGQSEEFLSGYWWWGAEFSRSGERMIAGRWEAGRGRYSRLALVDPETAAYELITPDTFDAWHPTWSPDGEWICFARAEHPFGTSGRTLWLVRPDGSDLRPLYP